jgi:hypothetical protein
MKNPGRKEGVTFFQCPFRAKVCPEEKIFSSGE